MKKEFRLILDSCIGCPFREQMRQMSRGMYWKHPLFMWYCSLTANEKEGTVRVLAETDIDTMSKGFPDWCPLPDVEELREGKA